MLQSSESIVTLVPPLFGPVENARTNMTPGTLYAASGESGWIYYGQVMPDKRIGFFRRRDRLLSLGPDVLSAPVIAQVGVVYPSIGRALRSGHWKQLGRFDVHQDLLEPRPQVNWPSGTLEVIVWTDAGTYKTKVDDPAIQDFEIIAAWDAVYHIPARLTADFGAEPAEWHVGGPVWRQLEVMKERERRFPRRPA